MVINEVGCVVHRTVEFKEERNGVSVWVCTECQQEFVQFEDLGSGA